MKTYSDTTTATSSTDVVSLDQEVPDPLAMKTPKVSTTPLIKKLYRGITAPIRLLPDFLIIGTQRGGTTSLYNYLQALPCIAPATTKEIHFFDRRFNKGLIWYRGHFPVKAEQFYVQHLQGRPFLTGEATPCYLFHPHTPKWAARALPHVKLIVLLRNPVDRAHSQYHHTLALGYETFSFEEAIQREEERTGKAREKLLEDEQYEGYTYMHLSYLRRGIYADQLQAWMGLFPREQFLVLKSEDFYADPAATLKEVLAFLKVPEAEAQLRKQKYRQYNNNAYAKMDAGLRKRLIEHFEPHNARLYDFLGVNFGWDQ